MISRIHLNTSFSTIDSMDKTVTVLTLALVAVFTVFILGLVTINLIDRSSYSVTGRAVGAIDGKSVVSCTDSDGADAWNTRGTVTVVYTDGSIKTQTDSCEGSATVDYSCSSEGVIVSTSTTPATCICQDGACIVPCSETQCNPANSQQICDNGRWSTCPGEQVCSLGTCKEPQFVAEPRVSGGGGGGGGSSAAAPSSVTTSVPERSLGTIDGIMSGEASSPEKLFFTLSNREHFINIQEITSTGVLLAVDSETAVRMAIGDERLYDFTGDNTNDFSLQLKSINLGNRKAKLLLSSL